MLEIILDRWNGPLERGDPVYCYEMIARWSRSSRDNQIQTQMIFSKSGVNLDSCSYLNELKMTIFGLILSKNGIKDNIRVYGSEIWQNNLSKIILNKQKRV